MLRVQIHDLTDVRVKYVHAAPAAGPDAGRAWAEVELVEASGAVLVLVLDDEADADRVRTGGKCARDFLRAEAERAYAEDGATA